MSHELPPAWGTATGMEKDIIRAVDSQGREAQARQIDSAAGEAKIDISGRAICTGAQTPEELETLFEDTLLLRDPQALAGLFEDGALLVIGDARAACGGEEIARLALATWEHEHTYIADPRHIIQARNIALIVATGGINVAHRGKDGMWRYVIVRMPYEDAGTQQRL